MATSRSHRALPPGGGGPGGPHTEITSLQEATSPCAREGFPAGPWGWPNPGRDPLASEGRQEGLGPSLLSRMSAETRTQPTFRKGVRSAPHSLGRNLTAKHSE